MAKIKVRARAVDMLGRQQIAGIPTAIHELFKNAHDAYADRVRVDYIHTYDMLILRDNGLGMTRADLEAKWLTLGTESKVGQNDPDIEIWTGPDNFPRRASLGEKGIGRLAIAVIGPQVLVLSRAVRPDGLHRPVCALVNWSLFEQPGIDLEQIDIPVIELDEFAPPGVSDLRNLVNEGVRNLDSLECYLKKDEYFRIKKELEEFVIDLSPVYGALKDPMLGKDYGTHFLVKPTSPELGLDLALTRLGGGGASALQRYLLGFGNTMHGRELAPPIVAEFVEHRRDGSSEDLIGPFAFFTSDEFASADHHIRGHFDEYGTFRGTVRIYDQVEHDYVLAPPDDISGSVSCGAFDVSFAYVQGSAKDTRMPLDDWKLLSDKLDSIGGLYIYRDGIRILPYGNSDVDWLNIERRRTLSAADWFFSYRRLMGDVRLTHEKNFSLVEKAGREGFRQNKAYRQMVSLLERLFERLALDFFREKARLSTDFSALRADKQKDYEVLQKRAKSVKKSKDKFNESLSTFFENVRSGKFEQDCEELKVVFVNRLNGLASLSNPIAVGENLLSIESEFNASSKFLRDSISISRPRNFGMTKRQQQDFHAYLRERERLINDHYDPLSREVYEIIHRMLADGTAEVDPRRRLDEPVRRESEIALTSAGDVRKKVSSSLEKLDAEIRGTISRTWADLSNQVEAVKSDLAQTEVASLTPDEIETRRDKLINQVRGSADRSVQLMNALGEQLHSMMEGMSNQHDMLAVTAALESENDELKEQVDQYADLAQIGMALGLVQHEFTGQVRNINRGLDALKPWASRNSGLDDLYSRLRVSFEHLESYLQLFIPLNRRLQRRRIPVAGVEIEEFVRTVFTPRFERHDIELIVSDAFKATFVTTFPSTLLPVFVNVVDNAIYWLGENRKPPKAIYFDVSPTGFSISNSGPGIDPRDAEGIFEFGNSNKPAGRGMGLYLSRGALRREKMDIVLLRASPDVSPTFQILIPNDQFQLAGAGK